MWFGTNEPLRVIISNLKYAADVAISTTLQRFLAGKQRNQIIKCAVLWCNIAKR